MKIKDCPNAHSRDLLCQDCVHDRFGANPALMFWATIIGFVMLAGLTLFLL